jgi:hypothetical protein
MHSPGNGIGELTSGIFFTRFSDDFRKFGDERIKFSIALCFFHTFHYYYIRAMPV